MKINLSLRARSLTPVCKGSEARAMERRWISPRVHLAMHLRDRYDGRARNEAIGLTRPSKRVRPIVSRPLDLDCIVIRGAISASARSHRIPRRAISSE